MTAAARISQADMDRAVKAAEKAKQARVIFRLAKGEIEVIIGEAGAATSDANPWDVDDDPS
jgi:hypothetical protein